MTKRKIVGIVATVVVLLIVVVLFVSSTVTVQPGYVGVVYSLNGGIQGDVLTQGLKIKAPWHKVTQYSVATEQGYLSKDDTEGSKKDDSFSIPTSDGKTVEVDLEYSYHFDSDMLPTTFTKFKGQNGKDIEQVFMRGKLKTWSGEVSSKFSVLDIYGERRSDLNRSVLEHVKKNFEPYGIVIDSISFSRIGLDTETEKAIQERVDAQQSLEKEKIETEKAKEVAQRKKVEAQGEADAKIVTAQGDAEKTKIAADAQAAANKKIADSLTDELLKKMEMEARKEHGWVTISGSNSVIVDSKK